MEPKLDGELSMLATLLTDAYDRMADKLRLAQDASDGTRLAKVHLEEAKASIYDGISDPKELGTNEAQREAKMRSLLSLRYDHLSRCEQADAQARLNVRLAELDLEHALPRTRLRPSPPTQPR